MVAAVLSGLPPNGASRPGEEHLSQVELSTAHPSSIHPATGELLEEFDFQTDRELETAIEQSSQASAAWAMAPLADRARVLSRLADVLNGDRRRLARDITLEMGKPMAEAEAEVDKCVWNCRYVATMGEQWLRDETMKSGATESYVSYLPLGTILAVMPWNFPLWQVIRFSASALMAGNAVLLKHAPNVLRCALNIEAAARSAGLPRGLLTSLIVPVERVASIIADPRVAAVTLTGSPRAGAAVAALAGAALKKSVLELGGSDAFIVLEDADIDAAVGAAVQGRFSNCGQICLAPKRFILADRIADLFESKFSAAAAQLRVGDPLEASTQVGPMARADLREELDRQVQASVAQGARVVTGGSRLAGRGNFYAPTVLAEVTGSMPVVREETFGPVAALMRAANAEEALALANDSEYGLSSNLWTSNLSLAKQFARRIQAGGVFINGVSASDPRLPVGGVKRSGYGRELAGIGIREFVNVQTVWIGPAVEASPSVSSD